MSTKINKAKFIEALRNLIKKEIEEVSTSAATPGYMTPMAFDGGRKKDKKKRDDIANQSGLKQVSEVKFAVTVDMGKLGQGKVLVDAGSKGMAKTMVAKKLKQGLKGVISVSRVQPALGKQVDKKIENVNEVTKKEVDALRKLQNSLEKLQKDYWNIAKIGDKTLKDRQFNKYYETILKATKEITTLRQILKGHIRNESITVDEAVDPKVKKQAAALLKRYTNNWKKLEKETEMMLKFAKKNKAREMAFNFEEVLKKLKGNVWSYISFQVKEPMDDYFYESINEGKYHDWRNDESLTPKQKIGKSIREVRNSLNELDKTIKMSLRLKNELNVDSRSYWKNTHKALSSISERLVKLASRVGNLK